MDNLKPCPFCNSTKVSLKHDNKMRGPIWVDCVYIRCKPCGGRGTIIFLENGKTVNVASKEAREAWNNRYKEREQ